MGVATASKKAGNISEKGLLSITVSPDGKQGGIFQVNSETDFVENNPNFQQLCDTFSALASEVQTEGSIDLENFAALKVKETERLVSESLTDLVSSVRENLVLNRGHKLESKQGIVGSYLHNRVGDRCGLRGSLVNIESSNPLETEQTEKLKDIAKDLAMHAVASKPQPSYLTLDEVPESVIEKKGN
eukprot:UN06700